MKDLNFWAAILFTIVYCVSIYFINKKFKLTEKHNTLWTVLFVIIYVALLTWVAPITYLSGEFVTENREQVGLTNFFTYPTYLIYNFAYILVYVILVGGFYKVLERTGAYRPLLEKVVNVVKKHPIVYASLTVFVISALTSLTGLTFEAIIFIPFIIAVVLMLGYDKITASLITVGSLAAGVIGNTFSTPVVGSFIQTLNSSSEIVKFTNLIWAKVALLVVIDALLVGFIIFYRRYLGVKKNWFILKDEDTKEREALFIPRESKKVKVWPLATFLIVFTVLVVLGTINWNGAFGITFFEDVLTKFNELTLFNYNVFGRIFAEISAFGTWTYNEIMVLVVILTVLIKYTYRVKFSEVIDASLEGAKAYLYPAIVIIAAYTVLIITSNHPVILTIIKPFMLLTDGFNSITLTFGTLISQFFASDLNYYTYTSLPLTYITSYVNDTSVYALSALITQGCLGLTMLVAPTSAVLLFNLQSLKIGYGEWIKKTWMFFATVFAILMICFTIILLVI